MPVQLRGPAVTVSVRPMPRLRRLSRPTLVLALRRFAPGLASRRFAPGLASRRFAPGLALLGVLGLGSLVACEKTPDAETNKPFLANGSGGPGATNGGLAFKYKVAPAKFKEIVTVSMNSSGSNGSGGISVDATGLLDISDAGNGKLKVGYSVLEVRNFEMTGGMKPKPKEGQPPPDLKAQLLAGKGARIIDLLGDEDEKASEALPENAKKPKQEGKERELDAGEFASFLGLPANFPPEGLAEGTPFKLKKEKPEKFGTFSIDMEIDMTYTLVKVDSSSGKRLAELKVEAEASGAKELSQGGQSVMISLDTTTESTIVWNLDEQVPVKSHIESTLAGNYGQFGSDETRIIIDATYEPAT